MSTSLDGVLIKKANKTETFTDAQIEDLAKCMDDETGYLHFARKFAYIQHPVQGKLLFDPFAYQVRLLKSYHDHRPLIAHKELKVCHLEAAVQAGQNLLPIGQLNLFGGHSNVAWICR